MLSHKRCARSKNSAYHFAFETTSQNSGGRGFISYYDLLILGTSLRSLPDNISGSAKPI